MSSSSTSIASSKSEGKSTTCFCGERCVTSSSWKPTTFGRRFRGCPKYWVGENCGFFEWEDPPTCEYGLRFGKKVLRRLEELQRRLDTLETNHKQRVVEIEVELLVTKKKEEELRLLTTRLASRERTWQTVACVSWVLIVVVSVIIYSANAKGNMCRRGYQCLGDGYDRIVY